MAQTDDPEPRMQIPEVWAAKMSCPVCGSRPLGVFHPAGQADRFVCQSCETSFELENNGTRIRFVTLPRGVTPWLRAKWVMLEEALAAFAAHQNETLIVPPAATPPVIPVEVTPPQQGEEPAPKSVEAPQPKLNEIKPPASGTQPETDYSAGWEPVAQPETPAQVAPRVPFFMANILPANPPAENPPKSPVSPPPFYEDDFEIPGIYPERIKSEMEKPAVEVWKNLEDERVKNSLLHPSAQEPASGLPLDDMQPVSLDAEARLQKDFTPPVGSAQPTTLAGSVSSNQVVKDSPDINNPPPVNPVEDTPPSPISYSRSAPRNISPGADLGDLRNQIVGAGNAPSTSEKIQAASQRAVELQKLGNTANEVRSILERSSGLTPEQVAELLNGLEKPEERKRSNRLLLIFSSAAMIIFVLIAWWFLVTRTETAPVDQQSGTVGTETTSLLPGQIVNPESLPAPLQTLIPNGVRIFNDPPSVEVSTTNVLPPTTCPKSKTEAAALFGGPANDWTAEQQNNGWVLVSQQQGLEIKVPANMTAGYLVFERGPEMRSVTGPAIVRNIYMITVSCQ
jgi:hypothetical protein